MAGARVLYIGGWGRCGSTLLDMLLGQSPDVVSAGEVREIWLRGCVENRPCGCGAPFLSCPFWTDVGDSAFGGWSQLDLSSLLRTRYTLDRPWGMPGLLAGRYATGNSTAVGRYTETLARLFRAIRDISGCNVVVDSSKIPSHGLILAKADVNLSVVHLVRDSRGVAYSAGKRVTKERTDAPPTLLPRYGAAAAAGRYMFYNGATSALKRLEIPYLRVRYEDLVEDPARRLREILAFVGENADADLSFVRQGSVSLGENHLVDGNPVRSARGQVSLQIDDDWRTRLPRRRRYVVTALTLPLLTAYGYPR